MTDILQACIEELKKNPVKKLGYLGRPGTDKAKLITETVSREVPVEWVYPSEAMLEVFDELESGSRCAVIPDQKKACELFGKVCSNLLSEGAELVFPDLRHAGIICGRSEVRGLQRFGFHERLRFLPLLHRLGKTS